MLPILHQGAAVTMSSRAIAELRSALGLKLVGESAIVYEADYVNALRTLAAEGIKRAPSGVES